MTAADWVKFLPGWFAAVVAAWTLLDKGRTRRHRLALGPDDDELRKHLATLRRFFKEIHQAGRLQDWFVSDDRRDIDEILMDLSLRRTDQVLTTHLFRIVMMWNYTKVHAPAQSAHPPMPWARLDASPTQPAQLELEGDEFRKQRKAAQKGMELIEEAVKRLNYLERKTIGRS